MSNRSTRRSNMRPSAPPKKSSHRGSSRITGTAEHSSRTNRSIDMDLPYDSRKSRTPCDTGRARHKSGTHRNQAFDPTSSDRNSMHLHASGHVIDNSGYHQGVSLREGLPFSEEYNSYGQPDFGTSDIFSGSSLFPVDQGSHTCVSSYDHTTPAYDNCCNDTSKHEFSHVDHNASPKAGFALYGATYDHDCPSYGMLESQPMCSGGSSEGYPAVATSYDTADWTQVSEELASVPMSATSSGIGCSSISSPPFFSLDYTIPEESSWPNGGAQMHADLPYRGIPNEPHMSSATFATHTSMDNQLTIEPDDMSPDFLPSPEYGPSDNYYPGLPFALPNASRRLSDGESTSTARKDPRYQATPGADKKYHCPFENDGCKHGPEKLKCNYDKHLDSHLKPYQCNRGNCVSVRFSSTACLLRHEREAHALHGHGDRPYLCEFLDCERAQPSKGFPRQWNLRDHMKRVHSYVVPDKPQQKVGLPSPPNSPELATSSTGRKKRSPELTRSSGTRKTKAASAKSRRDSHGDREALKAHWEKSFLQLSPKQLAHLQRCRDEGRDPVQDFTNLGQGVC